jgi:DNA-binding CsgD family transcriptional regulator
MKIPFFIQKPWKISKNMAKFYSVEKIQEALSCFNRACKGNFYMLDYHAQKLILAPFSAPTICGYSKDMMKKEGFDFYRQIFKKDEQKWVAQVNKEAYGIFFGYPESERQRLEFNYDLIAETINKQEVVLRQRLVPYKLCENGNMWLGLCHLSISPFSSSSSRKASITDFETGETYNFIDGRFVLSDVRALTPDEITVLDGLAKDIPAKQICDLLKISESAMIRKKRNIFDKLGVNTSVAAVHKATKMGAI